MNDDTDIGPGEPDIAPEDRTAPAERRRQQANEMRQA